MKTKYSALAFLAEVLVNIAVFSASCAVLVGVFSAAYNLAGQTGEKNLAMAELHTLAEMAKVEGEGAFAPAQKNADGQYLLYYTADWRPASGGQAAYAIKVTLMPQKKLGGVLTGILAVASTAGGTEICRLESAYYQQTARGAA